MRIENQTTDRVWVDSSFCLETSTKNAVQESHLWKGFLCKFQLLRRTEQNTVLYLLLNFLIPPPPNTKFVFGGSLSLSRHHQNSMAIAEFWLICINSIWYSPWARIFKLLRSPRTDSKEPTPPDCVAWRAGTTTYSYSVPIAHRLFKNSSTG